MRRGHCPMVIFGQSHSPECGIPVVRRPRLPQHFASTTPQYRNSDFTCLPTGRLPGFDPEACVTHRVWPAPARMDSLDSPAPANAVGHPTAPALDNTRSTALHRATVGLLSCGVEEVADPHRGMATSAATSRRAAAGPSTRVHQLRPPRARREVPRGHNRGRVSDTPQWQLVLPPTFR